MTVKELREVLSRFDPDLRVMATWEQVLRDFEESRMQVSKEWVYPNSRQRGDKGYEDTILVINVE